MDPEVLFQKIDIGLFRRLKGEKPGHREVFKEIALFTELYNFDYLETSIPGETKQLISRIIADNVSKGMGMRDIQKDIISSTFLNRKEAEHVSRNEVVRVKNLGNWYINKGKGAKGFTVNFTPDACDDCVNAYNNKVFGINEVEMLPPLHDLCMCVSIYTY